jgi:hypothetical protein
MAKEKDDKNATVEFELSELQMTYVKLATLSSGLSSLFSRLITETDERTISKIVEKINSTMDTIDTIIEENLLELDLTSKRS